MTAEQKLAHIARSLKEAGIDALVMGGHAVRYYGIDRNTVDFDLVTSLATPEELRLRLARIESLAGIGGEAKISLGSKLVVCPTDVRSGWSSGFAIICCPNSNC